MAYILNIDTALETASICLSNEGELIRFSENDKQREHAGWLQPGIHKLLTGAGISVEDLQAIAVSNGPGSYTGLRIGLSSAKGLCYALNIPLIAINTLDMMAAAAIQEQAHLFCPMIDARRMEVYTAVYNRESARVVEPQAMILNEESFMGMLESNTILFFGNGSIKYKMLATGRNAIFKDIKTDAKSLINISYNRFRVKNFDSVAYTQPLYIKEFHSSVR
jgi:tRNA threonylcarbamoyladenosine biosynthesis protein TsaB